MVNPLNLYATRAFSEHPLGLWALDDQCDYITFISESDQNLSNWSSTGVTSVVDATDPQEFTIVPPRAPFSNVKVNGVIADAQNEGLVTFTSPFQLNPADLDLEKETFSIATYVYSYDKIIEFRLGFRYTDPESSEVNEVIKSATFSSTLAWAAVAESFNLPESFENLELIFEIYYTDEGAAYEFVINAITAGQWAEEFQLKSFGIDLIDVPNSIAIQETKGVEAQSYGFAGNNGYYIANENALAARNFGLPLVFGSRNSTQITPKENSPSLIVPGFGFMNRSGQFNKLTAEFWIKIFSKATEPRKIFGPISSLDGLYVDGPFLKLRIGRQVDSHYVGEWDRPMLIDIRLSPTQSELILNGAIVMSLDLDPSVHKFPPSISDEKEQDWLGFYAYEDVPIIQLDCIGIYPYEVAAAVAKRRWVYGQGVQVPTDIKGLDSSSSVFIDYAFAKYAKNFYFPTSSNWSNGSIENLEVDAGVLEPPEHPLPIARFSDKTEERWFRDLERYQSEEASAITLRPNEAWNDTFGHLYYENLNFLDRQTRSFFGVFESKVISLEKKTLFEIKNSNTGEKIEVYYSGNPITSSEAETLKTSQDGVTVIVSGKRHGLKTGMKVLIAGTERVPQGFFEVFVISDTEFSYSVTEDLAEDVTEQDDTNLIYAYDSTIYYAFVKPKTTAVGQIRVPTALEEKVFYTAPGHKVGKKFMVGIHIPRFVREKGEELANFFGSRQNLSLFIAGSESLDSTFDGNIYRVSFASQRNLQKIGHLFNDVGIPVDYENVFDHFGPNIFDAGDEYFGNDPDYWAHTLDGGDPYDFQAIKAIDHIATYTLLPKVKMGMFMLDVAIEGYWEDYVPLSYFAKETLDPFGRKQSNVSFLQINFDYPNMKNFDEEGFYDTSDNFVKAYVAFQYLRDGSNSIDNNFTKKEKLSSVGVVTPGADWLTTKYEIVDGTIVYPPEDVDFRNLSVNVYLEYAVNGVSFNPVVVRSLQISSQAFGSSPSEIGTRFGANLVPFRKAGQYFDYKSLAPFAIYKGSSPYLYNTSNSGIEIRSKYENSSRFGISVPLNVSSAPFFKIGTLQLSLKYGEDLFPEVPVKIFEIESGDVFIKFFLVADSQNRKRGQIYALDAFTNQLQGNLVFFNNGKPVKRPVLYSNVWNAVGISFPGFLDIANFSGALRITSPIMFNNFSFYQTTLADDEERFGFRQWFAVRSFLGNPIEWGFWAGKELVGNVVLPSGAQQFTWQEVLFLSTTLREELDGEKVYNIYSGTDRSISDSDQVFSLKDYQYKVYNKIAWRQNTVSGL